MYGQFPVSVFKGGDSSENLAKHMKPIVDMEHDVERCYLDPQLKGFALKHHQNDSRQLFAKVKILHFFQNFDFGKC